MFGWEGKLPHPSARMLDEMRPVLYDPQCRCSDPLYFMYRDLSRNRADRQWLHKHHLRYDLTVIPPRNLCGEWVKTKGHYHPSNPEGVGTRKYMKSLRVWRITCSSLLPLMMRF